MMKMKKHLDARRDWLAATGVCGFAVATGLFSFRMIAIVARLLLAFITTSVSASLLHADESWRHPFRADAETVVLYHFDEGTGNITRDGLGDHQLTLRAKRALWGNREGFGSTARFERRDDDANLFVGPANNDKLHLRGCDKAWTIEAWIRYTGRGGLENGHTYANICGTEEEGLSLPTGLRGGWNLSLHSRGHKGKLSDGITPAARFMGSPRGKDPNHDTSSLLFPHSHGGGFTGVEPAVISDKNWHHVAWQFRYLDQTHFFFVDRRLVRRVQLPMEDSNRIVVNNAVDVACPFVVGGFPHSQDPPFHLKSGSFEGEIDEVRISSVRRYPVADRLAIVRQSLAKAGVNIPYSVRLSTDAAQGRVDWKRIDGKLPDGLTLDASQGRIHGRPRRVAADTSFTIEACDESGATDTHRFQLTVAKGELVRESLPPAFANVEYQAELTTRHLAPPLKWEVVKGALPTGISLESFATVAGKPGGKGLHRAGSAGASTSPPTLTGTPTEKGWTPLTIQVTDANGSRIQRDLVLKVLPKGLVAIRPDKHTVALYDWQGADGKLIRDRVSDASHTLTWTNMGGDRRVTWPGRQERFPQFTGHGEHGFTSAGKGPRKLDLKTCDKQWTVEAWIRRGGPLQGFGGTVHGKHRPFHFGHICGTYDLTEKGVWELYLSDEKSDDGSMAPGVHFFGAEENQALKNLHPWHRPQGIVGDRASAGIRDTEWHHVAWQYNFDEDLHELFLDGRLIWKMTSPDGRKLVNNREHDAQFSVSTRLKGYSRYGGGFNYLGPGNFFGQIGEIRISNVRRY